MAVVFISYRREDSAGYAGRLHEELEERLSAGQVFRDVDTLQPGQDFVDGIDERLKECGVCIALLGRGWLGATDEAGHRRLDSDLDYVRLEIATALARPDVLVIPVLVGGGTMPAASSLPENIRSLARRQAITLRDETWESDMDRLAEVIARHTGGHTITPPDKHPPSRRAAVLGVAAVVALVTLGLMWFLVSDRKVAVTPPPPGPSDTGVDNSRPPASGNVHPIEIPRQSEISHGDLIYTLVSGSLRPGQGTSTLWLRFRVSNEGRDDANLWDQSFRVAVGGQVVPASGGLNTVLGARSIQQQIVRFEIPSGDRHAILRINYGDRTGELPLDLSDAGGPPKHEEPDPGDALSRADMSAVVREPVPLVMAGWARATLTRATARRFANITRLFLDVRIENTSGYPQFSGDLVLRLAAGGELLAPVRETSTSIDAHSTLTDDVVFEFPTTEKSVVLRGSMGQASAEIPLTIR